MNLLVLLLSLLMPVPEPHETTIEEWFRDGPRLVRELPVYEVRFTDATPNHKPGYCQWQCDTDHPGVRYAKFVLPDHLFVRLDGFYRRTHELTNSYGCKMYWTDEEAEAALSRAAIDWARSRPRN